MEASGVSPEGFYVVLQKDNAGLDEDQWVLHVGDFAAFGEYTAKITGYTCQIKLNPFISICYLGQQLLEREKNENTHAWPILAMMFLMFQMSIWFPTLLPCHPNFVTTRLQDALMG